MASLSLFVCLLGLVALCHSDCVFEEIVIKDLSNPPKGCVDKDGEHHDFDSEWEKDCIQCSCTKEGMSCCSTLQTDIPEECELVVNQETCNTKIVMKSNRDEDCTIV